ncbi:hypothetical protein IFM89_022569 [Coptis chinensis]|uniref:Uncharacterized protein n=1 Tax=Coptis chinensis TaxID=261450 RepID=A0A835H4M1_9MAGN|nr:hypothetical protein IFM89_022569 [Coptis chinensis]
MISSERVANLALAGLTLAPLVVKVNPNLNVILTTCLIVYVGCYRSVKPTPPTETMSNEHAMRFPLIGSAMLLSLFLLFKFLSKDLVNAVLTCYFFVLGILALSATLLPAIRRFLPKNWNDNIIEAMPCYVAKRKRKLGGKGWARSDGPNTFAEFHPVYDMAESTGEMFVMEPFCFLIMNKLVCYWRMGCFSQIVAARRKQRKEEGNKEEGICIRTAIEAWRTDYKFALSCCNSPTAADAADKGWNKLWIERDSMVVIRRLKRDSTLAFESTMAKSNSTDGTMVDHSTLR